jgi:hypothetical protein
MKIFSNVNAVSYYNRSTLCPRKIKRDKCLKFIIVKAKNIMVLKWNEYSRHLSKSSESDPMKGEAARRTGVHLGVHQGDEYGELGTGGVSISSKGAFR